MDCSTTCLWITALFLGVHLANADAFAAPPETPQTQLCEVPIFGDGSAIVINVVRDKREYRFILDTGSAFTVLDSATFRMNLKPLQALSSQSQSGSSSADAFENPGDFFVCGRLPIKTDSFYHINLSLFSGAAGERIHGILGCDFLNRYILQFDGDAKRMRIFQTPLSPDGMCIKLHRDVAGLPLIKADLFGLASEPVTTEFLIDTGRVGFAGIILSKPLFESYLENGKLTVEGKARAVQIGGRIAERLGTVPKFTLWKTFDDIQVRERAGSQFNLVGLSYLMQFNFTLDLLNENLYLTPRTSAPRLLQLKDLSGLALMRESSDIVVMGVEPQSPAAVADIRTGDIVTSVDGVAGQKLRLFPMRTSFCQEGKTVRLGMRRDAKAWTIDLVLRDWRKPATAKDFE